LHLAELETAPTTLTFTDLDDTTHLHATFPMPKTDKLKKVFKEVFGEQMNITAKFTILPEMLFIPADDRNHDGLVGYDNEIFTSRFSVFAAAKGYEATIFIIPAGAGTRDGGGTLVEPGSHLIISDSPDALLPMHELGHHFGLFHAFDYVTPSCTGASPTIKSPASWAMAILLPPDAALSNASARSLNNTSTHETPPCPRPSCHRRARRRLVFRPARREDGPPRRRRAVSHASRHRRPRAPR